jgi:4-phytase / acid phosphatase
VNAVQEVEDCYSAVLCQKLLNRETCGLQDLEESGSADAIKQAHAFTQSFGEMLLLQYAQGFEGDRFAFGEIRPEEKPKWLKLLAIHTKMFDATQREPNVARPQGDNLLYHLALAIEGSDPTLGDNAFVVFVGHDTNIANVAALLGLEWQLPDYPQNDIPPGSALAFEVRKSGQAENVYSFMVGQPADALRKGASDFASRQTRIKGCEDGDGSCPLAEFNSVVKQAVQQEKY